MIRSKCSASVEELGDQYILLGPYKETSVRTEVEVGDFPSHSPLSSAVNNLRAQGWRVSVGDVLACDSEGMEGECLWVM